MTRLTTGRDPEDRPLSMHWVDRYTELFTAWETAPADASKSRTSEALARAVGPLLAEVRRLRQLEKVSTADAAAALTFEARTGNLIAWMSYCTANQVIPDDDAAAAAVEHLHDVIAERLSE